MNYLLYIEFAAENLQFYLWLKNYVKRFNDLPDSEKVLARPVEVEKQDNDLASPNLARQPSRPRTGTTTSRDIIPISNKIQSTNPFDDDIIDKDLACSETSSMYSSRTNHRVAAANAFAAVDVKYEP